MLDPIQTKSNKKTILAFIIGALVLFSLIEVGIVVYDYFAKNSSVAKNNFFKDNMAVYGEEDKTGNLRYGLIDDEGTVIIKADYDAILPIGEERVAVAKLQKNKKIYGIISIDSKKITGYEFEEIRRYSGKIVAAKQSGKWGFLDTEGNWAIKPEYEEIHSFSEGVASVKDDGRWFFIDKNGKMISKETFEAAGNLKQGLARVKKNGKWGYVDVNFNWLIKPQYEEARDFVGGLAAVCKDGKWGFIDGEFNEVIQPRFKYARNFKNGLAAVANAKDKYGYIATDGSWIIKYNSNYDLARDFSSSNRAAVYCKSTGKWNYIKSDGTYMGKTSFVYVGDFYKSLAPVSYNGVDYTYVDIKGNNLLNNTYAYASDFYDDGYSLIKTSDGKWFAIDDDGIPFSEDEYDSLISGNNLRWFLEE